VFAVMYPQDWDIRTNGTVTLKKYNNWELKQFDSLAMAMTLGEFDNPDNLPVQEVLAENHRGTKDAKEEEIAGKNALHTGKVVLDSGLMADGIYWALDKKIFYLETVYYDKQIDSLDADCQKVIDSIKFL
jgi:hypothetical protein